MQLHDLKGIAGNKRAKRVGRGGKRGTTSGRGQKGQKSRSGHRIRPAARDLIIRTPKLRGFRNKPMLAKPRVIALSALAAKVRPLAMKGNPVAVDLTALKGMSLVPQKYRGTVKVLGHGSVDVAIALRGVPASLSAVSAIEKAGGSVTK
jgi:large subunit ribosomal protein L15